MDLPDGPVVPVHVFHALPDSPFETACLERQSFATTDTAVDRLKEAARFNALRVNALPLIADRAPEKEVVCRLKPC